MEILFSLIMMIVFSVSYKKINSNTSKLQRLLTNLSIIIGPVCIFLIKIFTVKPNVISGNGNLGLIFYLPTIIILLFQVLVIPRNVMDYFRIKDVKLINSCILLFLVSSLISTLFLVFYTANQLKLLELHGNYYSHFTVNQYTNTLFINTYLYNLILLLSVLFTSIYVRIRRGT
mgnify:CR=1 FL=1